MSRKASLADYGLVGLVGGGIAILLIGMATLAIAGFMGRIPTFLIILLGLAVAVTVASLAVAIAGRDRTRR